MGTTRGSRECDGSGTHAQRRPCAPTANGERSGGESAAAARERRRRGDGFGTEVGAHRLLVSRLASQARERSQLEDQRTARAATREDVRAAASGPHLSTVARGVRGVRGMPQLARRWPCVGPSAHPAAAVHVTGDSVGETPCRRLIEPASHGWEGRVYAQSKWPPLVWPGAIAAAESSASRCSFGNC